MKNLNKEELQNAPDIIKAVYVSSWCKMPLGRKMIEEVMNDYPEYFPDELERKRKWDSIPENVHAEYRKECIKMYEEVYKDMPPSKGIFGWARDPVGYKEWSDIYEQRRPVEKLEERKLHEKYYAPFGIEYFE